MFHARLAHFNELKRWLVPFTVSVSGPSGAGRFEFFRGSKPRSETEIMADEPWGEETTIALAGPVSVYEAGRARDAMQAALAEGKPLRIDLSDTGAWDIAGLQLLIACSKSAEELGLTVRVTAPPRSCRELAERSGLGDWLRSVEGAAEVPRS